MSRRKKEKADATKKGYRVIGRMPPTIEMYGEKFYLDPRTDLWYAVDIEKWGWLNGMKNEVLFDEEKMIEKMR